jgi:predicted ester cyclase
VSAENKEIVRRLGEEPWQGKLDTIDELADPKYVGRDPAMPDVEGPEGLKQFVKDFLSGYPDGRVTIDQQLAEGDLVASRWTGRGTHRGELMGIAPTGKQVTVTGITISRVAGGKVVEEWTNWDMLGMLQQLGVVPAMEGAAAT